MQALNQWRRIRARRPPAVSDDIWRVTLAELPLLGHLSAADVCRLRDLSTRFLAHKTVLAKSGLETDDLLRTLIAAQACLPILNLDLSYYRDWQTVIVYPTRFIALQQRRDENGVVHDISQPLAGEAWQRGPLVLSWHDVLCRGGGFNVVIHECAHKLDMLNGALNGFPPLHSDMDAYWWSRVLNAAYDDFCRCLAAGGEPPLDPYAAESPSEFFAVLSELFFELPQRLRTLYPHVYRQLCLFYRQDPACKPLLG